MDLQQQPGVGQRIELWFPVCHANRRWCCRQLWNIYCLMICPFPWRYGPSTDALSRDHFTSQAYQSTTGYRERLLYFAAIFSNNFCSRETIWRSDCIDLVALLQRAYGRPVHLSGKYHVIVTVENVITDQICYYFFLQMILNLPCVRQSWQKRRRI